jgi:hypothetical protein
VVDIPRSAAELITHLDGHVGAPTMVPVPDGDTPVNIIVIVRSVNHAGEVNLRFGYSANTVWLDLLGALRETAAAMDRAVTANAIIQAIRGGGGDVDGFLRGLGLQP